MDHTLLLIFKKGYIMVRLFWVLCVGLMVAVFTSCTDYASSYENEVARANVTLNLEKGKFTDERDGNKYAVILVGDKYWMAENLRYVDSSKTPNLKGNTWCLKNSKDSCSKYGPLYSWTAALDIDEKYVSTLFGYGIVQGICPEGWHLPSFLEWVSLKNTLAQYTVGEDVGSDMKSVKGWLREGESSLASNRFGFSGMPAGRRNSENGEFMSSGKYAFFWSLNEIDVGTASGWALRYDNDQFDPGNFYKDHGMSVRCVLSSDDVWRINGTLDSSYLDEIPFEYGKLELDGKSYKTVRIGSQNWMAENMNQDTEESWCYNDDSKECDRYGRLYSFKRAKTVCPEGWKLPSIEDLQVLVNSVKYASALRSRTGWTEKGSKGWNLWGFNAKPSGGRESGDYFDSMISAYFWTSDQQVLWLRYYDDKMEFLPKDEKTAFSVRCIEKAVE
ncbi:MAG: hypothetical protein IKC23_00820 [Fibrobacter sp.]|nr:hypothetical protein [Fibrobacter sp.]MBR2898155.1 hypothetical protein [Fibrobacter sp.]